MCPPRFFHEARFTGCNNAYGKYCCSSTLKKTKPESANPQSNLRIPSAVHNALGWKEEDAKPAILGATLLFLIVAAFVLLKTIRDTSFLIKYPASTLAQYMALNTLISGAVAFLLLGLYKFISLRRLLQAA